MVMSGHIMSYYILLH